MGRFYGIIRYLNRVFIIMGEFSNNVKSRLVWVDNIKGFMLMCIILSHFGMYPLGLDIIAPLRVSSFFFLSGLLLNSNHNVQYFIRRKVQSLLLPYLYLSLLGIVIDPYTYDVSILKTSGYEGGVSKVFDSIACIDSNSEYVCANLCRIFIEGASSMMTSPLWFLWTLFMTSVLLFVFVKLLDYLFNKKEIKTIALSIVAMLSLYIAIHLSEERINVFLHFDACCIGLFFMVVGYLSKPLLNLQIKMKYMILAGVLLLISYVLYMNISGCLIIYCNVWGRYPVIDAVGVTVGLLMVCVISKMLFLVKNVHLINSIMSYMAKNALVVLTFHFVIIGYMKIFISPCVIYSSFYQVIYLLLCVLVLPPLNILFNTKLGWMIGK